MRLLNIRQQRKDMEALISRTFSAPPSPRDPIDHSPEQHHFQQASPAATTTSDSHHVLSRHSAIGQMDEAIKSRHLPESSPPSLDTGGHSQMMPPRTTAAPVFLASDAHAAPSTQTEPVSGDWAGDDMLSDMLGLHDLMDFGFAPLDHDLAAWRS